MIEIEALKLHLIEFKVNSSIKLKIHSKNYAVGGIEKQLVVLITYDKSIFNANDSY